MPRRAREQLIMEEAGAVFARRGYHSASMDEIAALADVSKPMLYTYFGSKEGLYVAYIEQMGCELEQRLELVAQAGASLDSRLRARISEFLRFVEENRDGWAVLYSELAASQPLADRVALLRERIAAAIRRLIERETPVAAGGQLSPLAAEAVSHAIVGAGESLANWWLEHPEVDREAVADWFVGLVAAAATAAARAPRSATR